MDDEIKAEVADELDHLRDQMLTLLNQVSYQLMKLPYQSTIRQRAEVYWFNHIKAALGDNDFPMDISIISTIKELRS